MIDYYLKLVPTFDQKVVDLMEHFNDFKHMCSMEGFAVEGCDKGFH
jgi:hypothetical protein